MLLCAASLVALSGCSVGYEQAGEDASPAPASPSASAEERTAEEPDETATGTDAVSSEQPSAPVTTPSALRDELAANVTAVLTCSGELTVSDPGVAVEVDGDCETLTVTADAALVLAGDVGTLRVTGAGSVVIVASADAIDAGGDINEVYWESGTPSVTDDGTANTVMPADRLG
jgi:hypothetical protein